MTWETFHRDYRRIMPKGCDIEKDRGGIRLRLQCDAGHIVEEVYAQTMPAAALKKKLKQHGWHFWGNKCQCPEHAAKYETHPKMAREQEAKKKEKSVDIKPEIVKVVVANDHFETSPTARKAKRDAMQWLEEAFDPDKGRYKSPDYSDRSIAKETGLSVSAVKDLREEFFGPIKEPSEIVELRDAFTALETRSKDVRTQAGQLIDNVLSELAKLRQRVEEVCERNGW